MEIYYFSGTGNSLAVARDMAESLGAGLIPVTSMLEQERAHSEADGIGLVFPIYDFKPPSRRGIHPQIGEHRYQVSICCVYLGIAPSGSLKHLDGVIKACGGHLSAGFAVGMPHSGVGGGALTQAERRSMLEDWGGQMRDGVRAHKRPKRRSN